MAMIKRKTQAETETLRARIAELEAALLRANDQAEHFEREWYLRGDRIEELEAALSAAEQDARRYRWMFPDYPWSYPPSLVLKWNGTGSWDAAVDAALAEQERQQ